MAVPLIWLIAAVALAGAEVLTGDLFLLMLGGGALATAGTSWLLDWPLWADGAVFLTCSCTGLISEMDFIDSVRRAAWQAGRELQVIRVSGAGKSFCSPGGGLALRSASESCSRLMSATNEYPRPMTLTM